MRESFPKIEKLFEHKTYITGVPTGFDDIDRKTRGLQAGDLVIVAARPSMGKTSLVLNICQHVATHGGVAGFFSPRNVEGVALHAHARVGSEDRHVSADERADRPEGIRPDHACAWRRSAKRSCSSTTRPASARSRCAPRRGASRPSMASSMLAIDYIQLMTGRGRFENRTLELASISRSLEGAGQGAGRPDRRAVAAVARARSALRQAPDALGPARIGRPRTGRRRRHADLPRGDVQDRRSASDTDGIAEIIIAKQRNGPTGTVKLAFIREQTRFGNLVIAVIRRRDEIRHRSPQAPSLASPLCDVMSP